MSTEQRVIAAIDVGTNSVHMVLASVADRSRVEVLTKEKDSVRLGSGLDDRHMLSGAAIQRGIDALSRCARLAREREALVVAVGTSALREARNAEEFLARAREDAGVDLQVISGREEARLIYLGVLQSLPVYDRLVALIDIGGGSTEVLFGQQETVLAARSFKLGAIRCTREYFSAEVPSPDEIKALRAHIRSTIAPFARKTSRYEAEVAVGSSGTIETIASIAAAAQGESPVSMNALEVTRRSVGRAVGVLCSATSASERAAIAGMDAARADIIIAGAIILEEVMDLLGMDRIMVSEGALREGLMLDSWRRVTGHDLSHLRDLRTNSIEHLMESCDEDPAHARQVARLALRVYDQLQPLHGMGAEQRELLYGGAMLSNVGQVVSHAKHHLHAYYVIRHTDRLNGFNDREVMIMALLARFHRRAMPTTDHEELAPLSRVDRAVVEGLVAILRVAIALDRSHAGVVADIEVDVQRDQVVMELVGEPGGDLSLERYVAAGRLPQLGEVLGRPVVLG